jgi:predicted RNase H-like HicB family nuclease
MANREFYVLIEQDEDEIFVSEVLKLKGCYTQGKTIDEVMTSMKEVIGLCFEDREVDLPKFVGIQK